MTLPVALLLPALLACAALAGAGADVPAAPAKHSVGCDRAELELFVNAETGRDRHSGLHADAALATVHEALRRLPAIVHPATPNACVPSAVYVTLVGSETPYALTAPLDITAGHTSPRTRVALRGVPSPAANGYRPVLTGGVPITGWELVNASTQLYRAPIPASLPESRQLWVDGVRAGRARATKTISGGTIVATGYSGVPDTLGMLANPGLWAGAEFVYRPGGASWTEPRCPVEAVAAGAGAGTVDITMAQPCFTIARSKGSQSVSYPAFVENALPLLDAPGEWFGDFKGRYLYYVPLAGQNMTVVSAIAGGLSADGQDRRGLLNVHPGAQNFGVSGLTFAFQTWLGPSSGNGYVDLQSGWHPVVLKGRLMGVPAALGIHGAHGVEVTNCTFEHLGLGGVLTDSGSQNVSITGCAFHDVSGAAVSLGNVSQPLLAPKAQDAMLTVSQNLVQGTPAEYHSCAGVFGGYVAATTISHNEIDSSSCGAICLGWGWGARNFMQDNKVTYNYLTRSNSVLKDTGSIYTLSAQNNSEVAYNYIEDQVLLFGSLYHDAGSAYFHNHHNVVVGGPMWLYTQRPSLTAAYDILVEDIYTNQTVLGNGGVNITLRNITYVKGSAWPAAALAIKAAAGIPR